MTRRRDRRRGRSSPTRTGSGRERSLVIYHTGSGRRAGRIRDVAPSTRSRPATGRSARSAARSRRASGCPTTPARSSPSATRGPGSSTSARAAELWERGLRGLARRLRGQRLLGVPRGPRRVARASGRGSPRGSAARAVPSLEDALRELQLEPVHVPFRAIFADGLGGRGPGRRATGRRRSSTGSRRGSRRFLTAMRDGRPACRGDARPSWRPLGPRADGARLQASPRRPAARADRADAARLARAVTDRRAGTRRRCRGDQPGLVRRAAAARRARGGLSRQPGFDEGEAWAVADRVRVLLRLPRPSAIARAGADRRRAAARRLARRRRRPRRDRRQHLGRRRVARPRPLRATCSPGPSVSTRSTPTRADGPRPCPSASLARRRGGRLSGRPLARGPVGDRGRSAASAATARRRRRPRRAPPTDRPAERRRATRAGSAAGATSAACRGR